MSELQILLLLLGIFLVTVIASNVWLAFQKKPRGRDNLPKHGRDGRK